MVSGVWLLPLLLLTNCGSWQALQHELFLPSWSWSYLRPDASVAKYLLELLRPICANDNVYQLKFMRFHEDPQANDILGTVLNGLDESSCAHQVTMQDDKIEQFMTSKKYFIIFLNNSPSGYQAFHSFLSWKVYRFGSARFIVVVRLQYLNQNPFAMFHFEEYNRPYNIVVLFYDVVGNFDCVSLEPFMHAAILHQPERPSFNSLEELFQRQYRNLHGYEFTIYFTRGDQTRRMLPSNRYWYFIDVLSRRINASYHIHTNDLHKWRENKPMDFGIVYDTFQTNPIRRIPLKQFSYHCILSPRSDRIPFIRLLIDPFRWTVWLALLLGSELTSYLLQRYGYLKERSFLNINFDIFQTFINGPPRAGTDTSAGNCILTGYIYASLILVTVYQSVLTARLSQKLFYPEFHTVDEVNRSELPIYVSHYAKKISSIKFAHERDVPTGVVTAAEPKKYHMVLPCDVAERWSRIRWDAVHLVPERVAPFQDTFVLFYYSPFDEVLDFHWTAFVEGDLFRYWTTRNWFNHDDGSDFRMGKRDKVSEDETVRAFNVHDLLICWTIFAVGMMLSCISFCLELLSVVNVKKYFGWRFDHRHKKAARLW
uniref:Ionotropic glutamate receptor C-terminal domain-containing protein n=1 Tax=Anopheles culicifacies TaxID=139723 RepID=A0A182LYT9_9DIPT